MATPFPLRRLVAGFLIAGASAVAGCVTKCPDLGPADLRARQAAAERQAAELERATHPQRELDARLPVQTGPTVAAKHGLVVSVCPIASRVGVDVLRKSGNAVDASVATAFALAVTWPEAGNIGGGGFMMVYAPATVADKPPTATFVDYRETAPGSVKADSFSGAPTGHQLAGTPGTVRGLRLAFERFGSGKVAWKDLVQPAVELAENGFVVDRALATSLNSGLKNAEGFEEFQWVYGKPGGGEWAAGDRLVLPDLAKTLRAIADQGPDGFYAGEVAGLIAGEMARGGGMITRDDLAKYEAKVREPIVMNWRGHTIHAPPPPSSGGVALLQMLQILDGFDLKPADRWSPRTIHLLVEAMRRAFADRAEHLGDPDFSQVLSMKLIEAVRIQELRSSIDPAKASLSESIAPWANLTEERGGQTTHFSVVDSGGVAVSNTYTLEQSFGGKVVVRGAGFLLNNELGDFNPKPGVTDRTGRIGTPPNVAEPGKRPLSSMTPVIVTRDGQAVFVTGSPGGRTIINTVAQVLLNRFVFGMSAREAVEAPRIHHQWLPDEIRIERSFARQQPGAIEALKQMGHRFRPEPVARQGDAHTIEVDPKTGVKTGAADPRIGGAAAGY